MANKKSVIQLILLYAKKILNLQRIRPFPMQEPNPAEPANHTL